MTIAVDTHARRQPGQLALPALVLAFAVAAAIAAPWRYLAYLESYLSQAIILPPILAAGVAVASLLLRPAAPFSFILDTTRESLLRVVLVVLLCMLGVSAFTTFKVLIPEFVPFYADPILAQLDRMVHGGDPGLLARAVVPAWAHYPLAFLYGPVWFIQWFGLMGFVALLPNQAFRMRYFWAMALTFCLLGTAAATIFSSVGPVFYERIYMDDRFAALTRLVFDGSAVGSYMAEATSYLYDSYISSAVRLGSGISAMPSMHIAVATLNAHMLFSFDRRAGVIGWAYLGAIFIGSIFLGWHYALDGYVSFIAVSLIWWGASRLPGARGAQVHSNRKLMQPA